MLVAVIDNGERSADVPVMEVDAVKVVPSDGGPSWNTYNYEGVLNAISSAAVLNAVLVFTRTDGGAVIVGPDRLRNAIVLVSE